VLLSVLGLYGNSLKYELFFNVDIIFGSIFAILAVRIYGYYGIIVGFIAGTYTYVLWNHPYAIIIYTAEAAFVAHFRAKIKNTVATDLAYWIICGIPIIFVSYHLVMGMDLDSTLLIMMKQTVNGVISALAAAVLYDIYRLYKIRIRKVEMHISYQHMIFQTVLVVFLVPMMIYIMTSISTNKRYVSEGMFRGLSQTSKSVSISIEEFIQDNIWQMELIKELTNNHYIKSDEPLRLVDEYRQFRAVHEYVENVALLDKDLNVILCSDPEKMEARKDIIDQGMSFGEWTGSDPYVSPVKVFEENVGERTVIFILSSLKDDTGKVLNYIRVAIDFDYISRMLTRMTGESKILLTLLDRNGNVIFSTSDKVKSGGQWTDRNISGSMTKMTVNGIYQYAPPPKANLSVMMRWNSSLYTKSVDIDSMTGFRLVTDLPLDNLVSYMHTSARRALFIVFTMILIAVIFAYLLSLRITKQLKVIAERTKDLPMKINAGDTLRWPKSYIKEAVEIQENFHEMAEQLHDMFAELRDQKRDIEQILDSIPLSIMLKDTEDRIIALNEKAAESLHSDKDLLIGRTANELYLSEAYYEQDKEVIRSKMPIKNVVTEYKPMQGLTYTARTSRIPVLDYKGDVISVLVVIDDITEELKQNEERERVLEIINKQARMAEIGALINIIIHQWKQPLNVISLVAQTIRDDIQEGECKPDEVLNDLEILIQNNNFLAQTISDFAGYYKQSKHRSQFSVKDVIEEVHTLIDKNFMKNRVSFRIEGLDNDFSVYNLKNEFKQVCLNILNNANDALGSRDDIEDKSIVIRFENDGAEGRITFIDNGGGVKPELLPDKIFEPYVTTKGSDGSGIGLYICRNIVEEHMGGKISAANDDGHAVFTIILQINKAD
jgi:PAS domain S-box-containing protein